MQFLLCSTKTEFCYLQRLSHWHKSFWLELIAHIVGNSIQLTQKTQINAFCEIGQVFTLSWDVVCFKIFNNCRSQPIFFFLNGKTHCITGFNHQVNSGVADYPPKKMTDLLNWGHFFPPPSSSGIKSLSSPQLPLYYQSGRSDRREAQGARRRTAKPGEWALEMQTHTCCRAL